jgi:hypothetical protein
MHMTVHAVLESIIVHTNHTRFSWQPRPPKPPKQTLEWSLCCISNIEWGRGRVTGIQHALHVQVNELELTPILNAEEAPVVVHGTYRRAWHLIKEQVCGVLLMQQFCDH